MDIYTQKVYFSNGNYQVRKLITTSAEKYAVLQKNPLTGQFVEIRRRKQLKNAIDDCKINIK